MPVDRTQFSAPATVVEKETSVYWGWLTGWPGFSRIPGIPCPQEASMPKAYHHVFFTVRDGISDDEVIERLRRYRSLAVSKGYIKSADDLSAGKVVIPAGEGDEVARIRQMTGGFTWGLTVRFDGREALDRYIKESPADIQAANLLDLFTQPPKFMAHDHVDQSA
jgi:hypothetical protein